MMSEDVCWADGRGCGIADADVAITRLARAAMLSAKGFIKSSDRWSMSTNVGRAGMFLTGMDGDRTSDMRRPR